MEQMQPENMINEDSEALPSSSIYGIHNWPEI